MMVKQERAVIILYMVSFLDLFAVSLILPSLPAFIKALGGGTWIEVMFEHLSRILDALDVGFITSLYGAIQMITAPLAGALSDIYDRYEFFRVHTSRYSQDSKTLSLVRWHCGSFRRVFSPRFLHDIIHGYIFPNPSWYI